MLTPLPLPKAPEAAASVLTDALAALAEDGPVSREAALGVFRRHQARMQQHVQHAFEQDQIAGLQAARLLGKLTDGLISSLYEHAIADTGLGRPEHLSIAATGGYGRGVLAPFSDIDLLFLTAHEPTQQTLQVVEYMLYFLWDLGVKVGHATRSIEDCLVEGAKDTTIRTALLDARHIAGDAPLFAEFHTRFRAACKAAGAADYIAAKQAERDVRHRRYGDSPFVVEPNIKEGRGGLRDLQTLYWIARYVYDTQTMGELADVGDVLTVAEAKHGRRAWEFLWTVRFHLHYVAGRAEERLTFDVQPVVGARMGYTRHGRQDGVERFMRHYFLTAREISRLTRILEPAILREALGPPAIAAETDKALVQAGFVLAEGALLPLPGRDFDKEPTQMLRILQVARDRNLELHPLAVRSLIQNERRAVELRGNPKAAALFMDLMCGREPDHHRASLHPDGARWLSVMNETGFLGRFIPDWARIVGQMQFDTYHVFTVDEHTIEAVRVLNMMERGELAQIAPVASSLVDHLQSRRALYLAMLLHDIAKGRGGDHSELGAEVALKVGSGAGPFSRGNRDRIVAGAASPAALDDRIQTRHRGSKDHSGCCRHDPIARAAAPVAGADGCRHARRIAQGVERLEGAVAARALRTGCRSSGRRALDHRARRARAARQARRRGTAVGLVEAGHRAVYTSLGYPGYWLSFDPETHARHARLVRDAEARKAPLTVETQPLPARAVTEVTVYCADHAGLFSKISGALAVAGASIVDARIHTMTNGMALDTFWVQDAAGGAFDAPHRLARLAVLIEQALSGRLRIAAEIRKMSKMLLGQRMRAIHVPPRVVIDNHASNTHTVLEVNGRDRPGLLHDVTAAISEQGLQIASAHVTTYGVRAVDVFYVKDVFGLKVENERKLALLRDALLSALTNPDEVAPPQAVPMRKRRRAAAE